MEHLTKAKKSAKILTVAVIAMMIFNVFNIISNIMTIIDAYGSFDYLEPYDAAFYFSIFAQVISDLILLCLVVVFLNKIIKSPIFFSYETADGLKRLGIACVVIPVIVSVLSELIMIIGGLNQENIVSSSQSFGFVVSSPIILGGILYILSYFLYYGAELAEKTFAETE